MWRVLRLRACQYAGGIQVREQRGAPGECLECGSMKERSEGTASRTTRRVFHCGEERILLLPWLRPDSLYYYYQEDHEMFR